MFLRTLFVIGLCLAVSLQAETEVKKSQETVSDERETTEQNNIDDLEDFEDSTELSDEEQPEKTAAPETGTLLHYMFDLLDCDDDYDLDSVLDDYVDDDNSSGSWGGTSCRRPCNRMYRPLCVSINGVPTTIPSPCEYQNRLRCANWAKRNGRKYPKIRYLYNGECRRMRNKRSLKSILTV